MTSYGISELSRVSGFPAATLRYYESVGLLEPERASNGYRRYGDDDLERLRFVGRAKRLGLRLHEIGELAGLRAQGRCPTVQGRLRTLVEERLAQTRRRMADMAALAAELASVARGLDEPERREECGEACECDTPAPVGSCSLPADDQVHRIEAWQRVTGRATSREATAGGVRLGFPVDPELVAAVVRLAVAERACCPWLTVGVRVDAHGMWLDVTAPPAGRDVVAAVTGVSPGG